MFRPFTKLKHTSSHVPRDPWCVWCLPLPSWPALSANHYAAWLRLPSKPPSCRLIILYKVLSLSTLPIKPSSHPRSVVGLPNVRRVEETHLGSRRAAQEQTRNRLRTCPPLPGQSQRPRIRGRGPIIFLEMGYVACDPIITPTTLTAKSVGEIGKSLTSLRKSFGTGPWIIMYGLARKQEHFIFVRNDC